MVTSDPTMAVLLVASFVLLLIAASIDAASARNYAKSRRLLDKATARYLEAVRETRTPTVPGGCGESGTVGGVPNQEGRNAT